MLTTIPIILKCKPTNWVQGVIEMKKYTFVEKLKLADVEDVIVSNNMDDLNKLKRIIQDSEFDPFDQKMTDPNVRKISKWLIEFSKKVIVRTHPVKKMEKEKISYEIKIIDFDKIKQQKIQMKKQQIQNTYQRIKQFHSRNSS